MKYRLKDGTSTKGSDWDEICFSGREFLVLMFFAGVGMITVIDYIGRIGRFGH